MDERIGFGLYQSSGNRESVGSMSMFGLWWCGWEEDRGLEQGLEEWVVLCVCEL